MPKLTTAGVIASMLAGFGLAGLSAVGQASSGDTGGGRVDISGFAIEGRVILNTEDFTRVIAPFLGPRKTRTDIERARSALNQAYHDRGHCEVRVVLKQPDPQDGVVLFRLVAVPAEAIRGCPPTAERGEPSGPQTTASAAIAPEARVEPSRVDDSSAQTSKDRTLLGAPNADAVLAQGATPVVPAPRFEIKRFEVQGNTLLSAETVDAAVSPFTGANKDFADIQRALEAIEQAYREQGYGVVRVLLPEQDITQGFVQFRVLEPRVGRVIIDGNKHFDAENIRHSLPTVKEGETPNSREIARNLQLLGEHPIKQTNVLLRSGAKEGEVDVNVKVSDEKPWRGFLTLDNTGTGETGYYRAGIGFQHTNLFNRDHTLTAQYITSPTDVDKVSIYGVGYRIPFYELNSSLDLIAGYSDVDSGVVQGLFNVSGAGTIGIVRWNYLLPRWDQLEQKFSLGVDYREYNNDVVLTGGGAQLVPDITIHPVSLTYSALRRYAAAELSFFGGASTNIPGGNDGDDLAFQLSRQGASENYTIFRGGFNYVRQFQNEWQTRIGANGQYTKDLLVSGEQYGIGGPDTVRGYLLREVANDRGYSGQAELYTPDIARQLKASSDLRMRFLAFYDYGSVSRNDPLPGEFAHGVLASTGVGLRLNYAKSLSLRFDVANILKQSFNREDGSWRVSAALAIIY